MRLFIAIHLCLFGHACAQWEIAKGYVDDGPATVYVCDWHNPDGSQVEFCYLNDSAEMLSDYWNIQCRVGTPIDRIALITRCWYHCDSALNGCNAHNGCWCPTDEDLATLDGIVGAP